MTLRSSRMLRRTAEVPPWPVCALATLVLSLATGTPRRSVEHFLPHSGEQSAPYLGV